jgi:hypothetical protein
MAVRPGPASRPAGSRALAPRAGRQRARAYQVVARRRRRNIYTASIAGGLLVLTGAFVVATALGKKSNLAPTKAEGIYPVPATVASLVEEVPVSALVANAETENRHKVASPERLAHRAPKLSWGGRPEIMYIGANYWPLCAAERWALVMALAKFGTFSGLAGTTSSPRDVPPSLPTFSFYGLSGPVKYTSRYLSLLTDEEESNVYNPTSGEYPLLQAPTPQEYEIANAWDAAPYTAEPGSLPFVYMAGKFVLTGSQFGASSLSRMSFQAAAQTITSDKSGVSKAAEAAAGYLVGDFCALTHDQPALVCSQVPSKLLGVTTSSA